jgi:hypothetical protein
MAPEKLLTAAKQDKMVPQMIIQAAEYFPRGRRWRRRLVGYSHAKYPAIVRDKPLLYSTVRTKVE